MAIIRLTARWTGFPGAPGYSNFFFASDGSTADVDEAIGQVQSAFGQWIRALPSAVTVQLVQEFPVIDEVTGMTTGYADFDEEIQSFTGLDAGAFSGPTGAVVTWDTAGVVNGRRVRGRTFLVPLSNDSYQADGTLNTDTITALNAGATALEGPGLDSNLVIWSRPTNGGGGSIHNVIGHRVPDMAAVLRSRRD